MRTSRLSALLAATAMAVYLLLVGGATTAVTDAAASCTAWPACGDGFALPHDPGGWLALAHRVAAVLAGLLVAATVGAAVRARPEPRVLAALGAAAALYPVQSVLGAYVAVAGAGVLATPGGVSITVSALHLVVGLSIFAGLLAALAWQLEDETGTPGDRHADVPPPADDAGGPDRPSVPSWTGAPLARVRLTAAAYVRLTKPRLMWLLCLVAAAAMALAGGPGLSPRVVATTLGGGALAIGAAGTFNHVLERDVDRKMRRTSDRPLAVDLVSVRNAVAFGVALAVVSVGLFASVNYLAAVLGLAAIAFYAVVYTLVLKPNTVQNTVLGGAAGALPALIGWSAVTGTVGVGGLALATLIFLWTPAHFYNLALAYREDYARGGFPMMPVVRGETATRRHVLWYFGATLAAGAAMVGLARLDWLYALTGAAVGAAFLWAVVRLHYEQTERAAFRAFHASNAYLGAVLLAVVVDALAV